jgi:hypothetical protein
MPDTDEVIERITPSAARRVMATAALGLLGSMLLLVAASNPPTDIAWRLFLVVVGVGSLWLSWTLWRVTGVVLELTRDELREVDGRVLARIENIRSVDRGFFAFKPASGFRLSLIERGSTVYAPGLWWRRGRMVMVGGVTSRGQSKSVADLISVLMAQRRGDL